MKRTEDYSTADMLATDKKSKETAAKLIKLMKEENLTYRQAMEVLDLCEVYLKDLCKLSD